MKTIIESHSAVTNSANLTSSGFTLRQKNLAKIINIVENDIYTDKILAVIREYSCNAYDAHVEAGKRDVPIVVSLPSKINPEFKVRDYGNGLTEKEIHEVYTSYGESTKENSDDYIGQLGIGSKSGFAYGDNFVVTSWKNGIKSVYNAVKGSDVREMVKLYSEPSNEPSGIEVSIPTKIGDDQAFKNKSINFFKYWNTKATLIGVSESEYANKDKVVIDGGDWQVIHRDHGNRSYYDYNNRNGVAVMGNISYPIQWNLVTETLHKHKKIDTRTTNIIRFITDNDVVIWFKIGELRMAPSREALQYTDYTVTNIVKKIEQICCELEKIVISQIGTAKTLWEFKCNINRVFGRVSGSLYSNVNSGLNKIDIIYELVKPKLMFNGVNVCEPTYTDVNHWDRKLGKIQPYDPKYQDPTNPLVFDPAVAVYCKNSADNLVVEYAKRTSTYFKIVADERSHIMIVDLNRKTHIKQCFRWYIENNNVNYLYTISFDNAAHRDQFFAKNDMVGATIVKLSDIFAKFKPFIPKRSKCEKLENDTVVCGMINPHNCFSYYRRSTLQTLWEHRSEVNLKTATGYYIDYSNSDGMIQINGINMHICRFMSEVYSLVKATGTNVIDISTIKEVRGFGKQIMKSKKFARNKGNWKNFVTHIEDCLNKLNKDGFVFSTVFNERAKHVDLNKFFISKAALGNIVSTLPTNHMLWELYKKFPKLTDNIKDVLHALSEFNIEFDDKTESVIALRNDVENSFNIIAAKYPMLKILMLNEAYRTSTWAPRPSAVAEIVDYINLVDNTSK